MKKTKKTLASFAIAGMALTMVPFNAFATGTVPTRLGGTTAAQTAVEIADQTGWTGTAILASSASYGMVDALTAGPLASYLKAPILLTGAGNVLDPATKAELVKLAVTKVYVTSGTAVISKAVLNELVDMNITVVPLGGFDRAATSVNIASKMVGVTKVAVANGLQDALSIAAIASAANQPILLTDKDALPASVATFLAAHPDIKASDIIGGTGIISEAVKAMVPSATRHAGYTAYDTNNQLIQDFAPSLMFDQVYVANGITGIDALAGAPLAAQTKSAIVLTDGTVPAAATFVNSKLTSTSTVTALGGTSVVPNSVITGIFYTLLEVSSVSALDNTNAAYGTTLDKVTLPAKVTLNLSNNTTKDVDVTWTSEAYDGTKAASYIFTGAYNLPEGVTGTTPAVSVTVIVGVNPDLAYIPAAEVAVTSLETAVAKDLTVEADLIGSEGLIQPAKDAVAKVNDATEKARLEAKVVAAEKTVTDARKVFDVGAIVTFEDANLDRVVRQAINKPTGILYESDVENITSLTSSAINISDISGIENLKKLDNLYIGNAQISDLNPIKGLTNLTHVYLAGNEISDISALEGLNNLEFLSLNGNRVSDISALKGLSNLQTLDLSYNQIDDIRTLEELSNLKDLYLYGNMISSAELQSLQTALPICLIHI